MLTADGFFEGLNADISWHKVDEEINRFIIDQLKTADTLLFGRKTFKMMEDFWPAKEAFQQDPETAELMTGYLKIVFSFKPGQSDWHNTVFVKGPVIQEITKLKGQPGKNIFVFGSSNLCQTLIENNLIDEYRFMINPIALGKGRSFFQNNVPLQLLKTTLFGNGNVLLCYRPD